MSSGWKGLAAELNGVGSNDPAPDPDAPATPPSTPTAELDEQRLEQRPPSGLSESAAPRRRRNKAKFTDTHRLVGVYFPHDLDAAFRQAAEEAGVSNSEFVVTAVRAYLGR